MLKKAFVVAVVAATGTASADPKFEYGKHDDVKDVKKTEWTAAAEAGVVFTTGNSETTTATGGLHASRKAGNNKLAVDASIAYAKSGIRTPVDRNMDGVINDSSELQTVDTVTAETLSGKLRYDRFLTEFNSLFVAALGSRDKPAGKNAVYGGQAGYSRRLYKSKPTEVVGELGYDYSREELVGGSVNSIHSARAFIGLKSELTEGATLDASLEGLTNLSSETLATKENGDIGRDTRVNLKVAVSAKIGKSLSFQTSIESHFDNRPAPLVLKLPVDANGMALVLSPDYVPVSGKLDTLMKASLIYTFF